MTAPVQVELLSQRKVTVASSQESSSLAASLATDGKTTTRWASQLPGQNTEWIYIYLGRKYAITNVHITWEAAYARHYQIQVSDDALSWTDIHVVTDGTGGVDSHVFDQPPAGRYLRVLCTARGSQWGYSIWELRVSGYVPGGLSSPPAPEPPPPTAPPPPMTPSPAQPLGIPGVWALQFSDEFTGPDIDTSKWNTNWFGTPGQITKPVTGIELAAYATSQAVINANQHLELRAIPKVVTATDSHQYGYVSGMVNTYGKYSFKYGAAEAQIYCPAAIPGVLANWPAFWLDTIDVWPNGGEIDIFEGLDGRAYFYIHYSPTNDGNDSPLGQAVAGSFTGWHIYGMKWTPGAVAYYYDGLPVGTLHYDTGAALTDMMVILNYAVGGWGGPCVIPATMFVNYVRVWQ
jgi:hypothetical protein